MLVGSKLDRERLVAVVAGFPANGGALVEQARGVKAAASLASCWVRISPQHVHTGTVSGVHPRPIHHQGVGPSADSDLAPAIAT